MSENAQPKVIPRRRHGLELLIEIPAVIVTFVMMVHITANAVLRTWWNAPIDHTLEIVQYWYLPIVAFLGFIAAQYRGQHIAADLIYERLPRVTQRYVLSVVFFACALVCIGFAYFGFGEAMHAFHIKKKAGVSTLVSWPTYFLVPLAFGSLVIQFFIAAAQAIVRPEAVHFVGDPDDALLMEQVASDTEPLKGQR